MLLHFWEAQTATGKYATTVFQFDVYYSATLLSSAFHWVAGIQQIPIIAVVQERFHPALMESAKRAE